MALFVLGMIALRVWNQPPSSDTFLTLYGGVKDVRSPRQGQLPQIEVIEPRNGASVPKNAVFSGSVRLRVASKAELPSFLIARLMRNDVCWGETIPEPKLVEMGVYDCSFSLEAPKAKGKYDILIECIDIVNQHPKPDGRNIVASDSRTTEVK